MYSLFLDVEVIWWFFDHPNILLNTWW